MYKKSKIFFLLLALGSPLFAHAQTVSDLIKGAGAVIKLLIPFAYGVAVIALMWGVVRYIYSSGDDKAVEEGRRIMIGGVIGLFIITAVWAIVAFLQAQFGFLPKDLSGFSVVNLNLPGDICVLPLGGGGGGDPKTPTNFRELICFFVTYIARLFPLIGGLMLLVFIWGVAKYIYSAGNEKALESGRLIMLWGIIGLFILLSVWGIANFLAFNLGIGGVGIVKILPE